MPNKKWKGTTAKALLQTVLRFCWKSRDKKILLKLSEDTLLIYIPMCFALLVTNTLPFWSPRSASILHRCFHWFGFRWPESKIISASFFLITLADQSLLMFINNKSLTRIIWSTYARSVPTQCQADGASPTNSVNHFYMSRPIIFLFPWRCKIDWRISRSVNDSVSNPNCCSLVLKSAHKSDKDSVVSFIFSPI